MSTTFRTAREQGQQGQQGIIWRRELPPVLAVAGLAADYLSPAALWTLALPMLAVAALLALRSFGKAALVFVLSSWILIPTASGVLSAFDARSGTQRLLLVGGGAEQARVALEPCFSDQVRIEQLPVGRGHLINPRWVLKDTIRTFVGLHNERVLDHARRNGWITCGYFSE
jgi:hypothetical protein